MKKNIAIVMGGYSGEHDISIMSGTQVYQSISADLYNRYRVVVERDRWFGLDDDDQEIPLDRADFTLHMSNKVVKFDLAFIIIHGNPGENGVLQGYFDMLSIPYTTCGFYTSALTFNKAYCNAVVRDFGITKVARSFHLFENQPYNCQKIVDTLGLPLFVKPAAGGSSVATTKVKTIDQLEPAIHRGPRTESL